MTPTVAPQKDSQPAASNPSPIITTELPRSDGVRDTIESVVVAFILAFVFRAFVVEAFVIPTGSMAPGLYGKHASHRCALCHYPFVYGIRETVRFSDNRISRGPLDADSFAVRCPNCNWTGEGNAHLNSGPDNQVVADSGDRILVMKWSYDIGGDLLGPKRWDIVVFKDPQDGDTNFIKRLVGLPGEVLEIIDGDLYVAPASTVPQDILDALSQPPRTDQRDARRLTNEQAARLTKLLKIQRKTPTAQQSLWMLHFDHDFRPDYSKAQGAYDFNPPVWQPHGGQGPSDWDVSTPVVRFTPQSDQEQWLELAGKPVVDSYAYNDVIYQSPTPSTVPVGDVRLKFVLFPTEPKAGISPADMGHLTLMLRKGSDEFQVTLRADGEVALYRIGERGIRRRIGHPVQTEPLRVGKPLEVEFENLDYRVALRLGGREIVATSENDYAPNPSVLLEQPYRDGRNNQAAIMIGARNLPLDIRHLAVHRDVFYRSDCFLEDRFSNGKFNPYSQYPGWGTAMNPIYLRRDPGEYFCCGDNSPQSKDSRMWSEVAPVLEKRGNYQHGTVPADQMIGRAFFVYWPSGLRFSKDTYGVIPNVGRMRMIR